MRRKSQRSPYAYVRVDNGWQGFRHWQAPPAVREQYRADAAERSERAAAIALLAALAGLLGACLVLALVIGWLPL